MDCSYYKYRISGVVGNFGCNGGYDLHTLYYVQQNGIQPASTYPYVGYLQSCKYSSANVVARGLGIFTASFAVGDVNAMKAVVSKQPLMVYMFVTNDFYSYSKGRINFVKIIVKLLLILLLKGIYTGPNCLNSKTSCPLGINHAVTIVGYGTENGVPFWRGIIILYLSFHNSN